MSLEECFGDENTAANLQCLPVVIQNAINWILILAGVVALILVIIAGIKLITSSGDAKQVEGAKKTLTYAIIGLVVIMLSFFIIRVIAALTGVTCIEQFGFGNCK
ncbi:MAG: pilin [Patescibacteria group bacterium]|nr:pilin [Patescibacteria group bacterium]